MVLGQLVVCVGKYKIGFPTHQTQCTSLNGIISKSKT